MKIGFIGTGQMGRHMAGHVLEAGYDLVIHDADRNAAAELVQRGAAWADMDKAGVKRIKSSDIAV